MVSRTETIRDYARYRKHKNAVIGISAFFGVVAYIIRLLRIRKVFIYYCIDYYVPEIAKGWFDRVFIWWHIRVDRFLVHKADRNWVISERIAEARWWYGNFYSQAVVVPLCYPPAYFKNNPLSYKGKLVFVGLNPYGMDIIKSILRDLHLELVTIGLDKKLLDTNQMLDVISECSIGLALFKGLGNHYYGDPGKTKLYLTCGIPVIVTNNTVFSRIITERQAGVVIDYDKKQLRDAIIEIYCNYEIYKSNARRTADEYCNSYKVYQDLRLLE